MEPMRGPAIGDARAAAGKWALGPFTWLSSIVAEPLRMGHLRPGEVASVAAFTAAVGGVFATSAAGLLDAGWLRAFPGWVPVAAHLLSAAGVAAIAYGALVEPFRLSVRTLELRSRKLRGRVRVAHLSDLHVRSWGRLEEALLDALRAARPDAILLTGDYSTFPGEAGAVERVLSGIARVAPTYASLGNCEYLLPLHESFEAPGFTWLVNSSREVASEAGRLIVTGINPGDEAAYRKLGAAADEAAFRIGLYHYPDLVPELAASPYDLTLSGHTHGGQIRLPALGALISMSRAGVKYARGLFLDGGKAAFVTQGVGCESFGLPRIRFLCPPELAIIDLAPAGEARSGRQLA